MKTNDILALYDEQERQGGEPPYSAKTRLQTADLYDAVHLEESRFQKRVMGKLTENGNGRFPGASYLNG